MPAIAFGFLFAIGVIVALFVVRMLLPLAAVTVATLVGAKAAAKSEAQPLDPAAAARVARYKTQTQLIYFVVGLVILGMFAVAALAS